MLVTVGILGQGGAEAEFTISRRGPVQGVNHLWGEKAPRRHGHE